MTRENSVNSAHQIHYKVPLNLFTTHLLILEAFEFFHNSRLII